MGRRAIGFEIDESRVTFARRNLTDPTWMRHVDVRHADWSQVPPFQLSITSPPYMTKQDHEQNPLSGYRTLDGNYVRYLTDLQDIYRGVAGRAAAPDARLVVNVANLHGTRLAWMSATRWLKCSPSSARSSSTGTALRTGSRRTTASSSSPDR